MLTGINSKLSPLRRAFVRRNRHCVTLLPSSIQSVVSFQNVLARSVSFSTIPTSSSATSSSAEVQLEIIQPVEGADIAIITLNRPSAKNALSMKMLAEFATLLDSVRFNPSLRAVLFRSAVPGVFCAGADLKERSIMNATQVRQCVHVIRSTFGAIAELPMPTIAVIEGAALGGGMEMALACDFRIANEHALFGLPETGLAIIPGAGGTQRLPRLIGVSKAKELIFTAKKLTAVQAHAYGLLSADVVVSSGASVSAAAAATGAPSPSSSSFSPAVQRALTLASEIAVNGPVAVRAAKEAIERGLEVDLATGLAIERSCYAQVIPTTDRLEGLKAFREKRRPRYTGE